LEDGKQWVKNSDFSLGEIVLKIKRPGFWKSTIKVSDGQEIVSIKNLPQKMAH
jgi:hypothetical protein